MCSLQKDHRPGHTAQKGPVQATVAQDRLHTGGTGSAKLGTQMCYLLGQSGASLQPFRSGGSSEQPIWLMHTSSPA